jgi:hypothetical protein
MTFGLGESHVEQLIEDLIGGHDDVIIATYAKEAGVQVHVTAVAGTHEQAELLADETAEAIRQRLGIAVFGTESGVTGGPQAGEPENLEAVLFPVCARLAAATAARLPEGWHPLMKALKIWWLYWRYRNITQRRQRFQLWIGKRRRPSPRVPYRPRGTAVPMYRTSSRQVWLPILAMAVLLALLETYGGNTSLNLNVLRAVGALVVVGGVYGAMRSV